jgi:hypothetical protein
MDMPRLEKLPKLADLINEKYHYPDPRRVSAIRPDQSGLDKMYGYVWSMAQPPRVGADHLGHAKVSMTQDRYMARGRIHTAVADLLDRAINDE